MTTSKPLKVLIVTPYFHPARSYGGPTESVATLVQALVAADLRVDVVTTNADGAQLMDVPSVRQEFGATIYAYARSFNNLTFFHSYFVSRALYQKIAEHVRAVDLVHIQGTATFPGLVAARTAKRLGVPYVLSPRGTLESWALDYKSLKKKAYFGLFEDQTLHDAACIHFTSEHEQSESQKTKPFLKKTTVVPNPIMFTEHLIDKNQARQKWQIDEQAFVILYFGRLHPVKNLELLFFMMQKHLQISNACLYLVGPADTLYRQQLENLISQLGLNCKVFLRPAVNNDEKWSMLRTADVFILPSFQENFGMAAAEAASMQIPIVTSSAVGLATDLQRFQSGIVTQLDAKSFAVAVQELYDNATKRVQMGQAGRQMVRECYAAATVGRQMRQLFEDVIHSQNMRRV